jgi:hypothetical protein
MPTIKKPNQHFDATLYTQNGEATNVVTNAGGFQPDLVWIKSRSGLGKFHNLIDSVRGVSSALFSNSNAEQDSYPVFSSFNSNGFTLPLGDSGTNNTAGLTQVAWQWKAGGASTVNTSGSISSNVSVSTTAGFSVVTYTGTGANATVGHGLGVAPKMVIVKRRNSTSNWHVLHTSISGSPDNFLYLNSTSAVIDAGVVFNGSNPSSTVFSVGTDAAVNASGGTYVAYLWSEIAGFSSFGSYTGNNSADGNFLYFGFRPKWIMIKNITTSGFGGWVILDTTRNPSNVTNLGLAAESSGAEFTVAYGDALSNGFKIRIVDNGVNASGQSYIYAAFAEAPFKFSNAR